MYAGRDQNNQTESEENKLTSDYCGANFCFRQQNVTISNFTFTTVDDDDEMNLLLEKPSAFQIHMLFSILLGFALMAAGVLAVCVDPTSRKSVTELSNLYEYKK